MSALIQEYIRRTAAAGRDTEQVGPFLATFSRHSTNPFLNYAIPDAGAQPSAADVAALADAYARRERIPRLEYLPKLAPDVEPALLAGGFTVDDRLPVMSCADGEATPLPVPAGIELVAPVTDRDLRDMLAAQQEAYDEPEPPTDADVASARRQLSAGGLAVVARDGATGEPAGGGICTPISDGVGELAGFGVRPAFRRRGIAAAITAYLTAEAHRAGARFVFLTPESEPVARIYRRAGFHTIDEIVFISRRVTAS
ncbi:GNAT family N-acetyltransferase [Planosporangium sp. 12N6]|uniref:GNAT family N-acetyltransferase n=1 Tax=Planosporangium spinosum TaxID=3402278 RepID=UPI003CEECA5A